MKRALLGVLILAGSVGLAGTALADGAAVYKSKCAMCHGADGQGSPMGPAFKGSAFITSSSSADIEAVITGGRAGADKKYPKIAMGMPPQKLDGADLKAVVEHLKALGAK